MSKFSDLWSRLVDAITGEAKKVEDVLTELEQRLMPGFAALLKQIETTIGQQGIVILEQGLQDIVTVIESGGNVGAAISALVPQVIAQVKDDEKQDATNAAHGAVALIIAGLKPPAADTPAVDAAGTVGDASTAGAQA